MFRKSALAIALGALANTSVMALGLGEIELKSALNQPLNAEVELLSATESELDELKVAIGSAKAFANAGIERPLFLNKLKFKVTRNTEGTPVILITSRDVVREPFLDFLLEMSWSKGRLLREYTVLVDPPVTMPAAAPVTQAPATQSYAGQAPAVSAAPSRRVTHTAQMPPLSVSPGEYGPTRRNDTLWGIAERVRPDTGVSIEQTMLGLQRANPEAFVNNNINNLKAGYVLRVPSREELTAINRREASREARAQYAAWRASRGLSPVASGVDGESVAPVAGEQAVAAESSLQLVAPEGAEQSSGLGGESMESLQRELLMANEAIEEQRRQNEEATGRLSVLEEQIINMQRLIQLKDNELARLQAHSGGEVVDPSAVAESGETLSPEAMPETATAEALDAESITGAMSETEVSGVESYTEGEIGTDPGVAALDDATAEDAAVGSDVMTDAEQAVDAESALPATPEPEPAPVPAEPSTEASAAPVAPVSSTPPGFIDRLLANPLWLGAGGAVLALLAFFGLRRKRSVETEFQESILQAAQNESRESDSEIVASQPESTDSKTPESSLLSEFAVSDMGSVKNDGEADPLAEADVYLAYGRYKQAEDLIKDALEKDSEREDLNLKLLEVFMAGKNEVAFDEYAQEMQAKIGNTNDPMWLKIAEMGRELNPANPMYQEGAGMGGADELEELDSLSGDIDFDAESGELPAEESAGLDENFEFKPDTSFDPAAEDLGFDESEAGTQDNSLEFDMPGFDEEALQAADEVSEEEAQGDGELADLDEVSTKLDLARAYIDMGDPDGAKSILDEVMEEGSDNQRDEARDIMAQMS